MRKGVKAVVYSLDCAHKDLLYYMIWESGMGYDGLSYWGDLDILDDDLKNAIDKFAKISLDKNEADKAEKEILDRVAADKIYRETNSKKNP